MANNINAVIVCGRLTRDCELKATATGTSVCRFSIGTNRRIKKNNEWTDKASFFEVVLWGKSAEALTPYLVKGRQVIVNGILDQEAWEKDGQYHSKVSIIANAIQLCSAASGTGNSNQENQAGIAEKEEIKGFTHTTGPEEFEDVPF